MDILLYILLQLSHIERGYRVTYAYEQAGTGTIVWHRYTTDRFWVGTDPIQMLEQNNDPKTYLPATIMQFLICLSSKENPQPR